MRLLERDPRTDASTPSAWLPTRTTQASNFSLASRAACSEFMETASMPNCRKHSESRLREGSCRSTKAARARSFLEEDKGTREFPNAISCDRLCAGYFVRRQGSSWPMLVSSRPWRGHTTLDAPKTSFWRGTRATAIAKKYSHRYKGVITRGDRKHKPGHHSLPPR